LNFLHPLFLYTVINYNLVLSLLVFSLLLADTSTYRLKINKYTKFLFYFLALAFITFFFGSWWALQESTWGGW
jgi:cytochrome c biogenesis factor